MDYANKFAIIFKIFYSLEPIVQRLGDFLKNKELNYSELAELLGYKSPEKISRLFRVEGAKPSVDIIEDIANKFVDLNVDWLLTGRGEMILAELRKEKSGGLPDRVASQLEKEINQMRSSLDKLSKTIAGIHGSNTQEVPAPKPLDLSLDKKYPEKKLKK